jgi:hypothetical protein
MKTVMLLHPSCHSCICSFAAAAGAARLSCPMWCFLQPCCTTRAAAPLLLLLLLLPD